MIPLVEQHRAELEVLCKTYHVRRLDLFGSAATGAFKRNSDLDFIVEFEAPGTHGYADRYMNFAESLERLFERPVDLLIEQPLSNPYFRASVEETRQNVYEARNKEAAL